MRNNTPQCAQPIRKPSRTDRASWRCARLTPSISAPSLTSLMRTPATIATRAAATMAATSAPGAPPEPAVSPPPPPPPPLPSPTTKANSHNDLWLRPIWKLCLTISTTVMTVLQDFACDGLRHLEAGEEPKCDDDVPAR